MADSATGRDVDTGLLSPTRVRTVLSELGMSPSKTLGQNFLIDVNILGIVLEAAELERGDRVIEVGPGLGVVTGCLLEKVSHVLAIEKDRRLCEYLARRFGNCPRLTLVCKDALDVDLGNLPVPGANKMVSNLPYCVASRVLVDLAGSERGPDRIVVTVQEEVARRLTAGPGEADYGLLNVRVRLRYSAEIVKKVSPTCFWPVPRVGSMIVLLRRRPRPDLPAKTESMFELATKIAFEHRRKQMRGILMRYWPVHDFSGDAAERFLGKLGIGPKTRPGEIGVEKWLELAEELGTAGD